MTKDNLWQGRLAPGEAEEVPFVRVGFAGYPNRTFEPLWPGGSINDVAGILDYCEKLKLDICELTDRMLSITDSEVERLGRLGMDARLADRLSRLRRRQDPDKLPIFLRTEQRHSTRSPYSSEQSASDDPIEATLAVARQIGADTLVLREQRLRRDPDLCLERLRGGFGDRLRIAVPFLTEGSGVGRRFEQCLESQTEPLLEFRADSGPGPELEHLLRAVAESKERLSRVLIRFSNSAACRLSRLATPKQAFLSMASLVMNVESVAEQDCTVIVDLPERESAALALKGAYCLLRSGDTTEDLGVTDLISAVIPSLAGVGSRVLVRDLERGVEVEYSIVPKSDADPSFYRVSPESAVGRSLMGREPGAVVKVQAPGGSYLCQVIEVS